MLTPVFLNSFSIDSFVGRKFAPYVPTIGIAHAFEQGVFIPGRYGGFAWDIFNTAFWEINYTTLLPAPAAVVNLHVNIKPSYHSGDPLTQAWFKVLFARFQYGNMNQIGLRINEAGKIEVVLGGEGRNDTGTAVATTADSFPVGQWADLECRVAIGTPGNVRIWREGVEIINVNLNTNPQGSMVDRVTLRWETFGPPGMAFCDMAIGVGDAAVERFGVSRVTALRMIADYAIGGWVATNTWPNRPAGPTTHFGTVNDALTDLDRGSPDDQTSYLFGAGSGGDDLFGAAAPECFGANLGLAVNVASLATVGAPRIQPIALFDAEGAPRTIGSPMSPETARYAVQQHVEQDSPATGDRWGDREIESTAWGVRDLGGGSVRVSVFYLEKLTSLDGVLPFECGGGNSYIY